MRTLEDIRAQFEEDGNVDISKLPDLNEAIVAELAKSPAARQITPSEYLELTEAHFGQMVQFLLAQMADVFGYVTEIHRTVEKALSGETKVAEPQQAVEEFMAETLPFVTYDRLARLYQKAFDKNRQRLVTP